MDNLPHVLRHAAPSEKKRPAVDTAAKIVDVTSSQPAFSGTHRARSGDKKARATTEKLLDRENRAVAQLLTRFKNIIDLAPEPKPASQTTAAIQSYQMEVETAALIRAAEDLLSLTRLLKEMYLFGPLRAPGEGDGDGVMVENARKVQEMIDTLAKKDDKVLDPEINKEQ